MTDQERDELRRLQDDLLTVAYRRDLQPHDLIITNPPVTVHDFATMIYPKLIGSIRDLHRQYYPKQYA